MKRTMQKVGGMVVAAALAFLAAVMPATANNIAVTNVALVNQNSGAKTLEVKFDLSWDNSWRAPCDDPAYTNWDAAWVFVKFIAPGSNKWEHALLSTNGHTAVSGSAIAVGTNDANGVGAFVYSSGPYTGRVNYAGTRLLWNYGANGYDFAAGASVTVSVQAIEMVYVPQGPFYLGSTGTELYHFYKPDGTAQTTNAYLVVSEDAIDVGSNSTTKLWASLGISVTEGSTISNAFPKGYNAFYCMKYDVSQGQYCDFLNMLTRSQQNTRTFSATPTASNYCMSGGALNSYREGIRCPATIPGTGTNIVFGCDGTNNGAKGNMVFNEPRDAMDRACNYLSWSDGAAYAAWAGLRPMTELEYEKACRGPATPVANEYAWGDTTATLLTTETPDGYGTSTANSGANCLYVAGVAGPCRVGIFATTSSTRASAGATYWGIMEMSGNLWKRPVSVGSVEGRAFKGSHGSGVLSSLGKATNTDWNTDGAGTDAAGSGRRGGSWNDAAADARVSDRHYAGNALTTRSYKYGARAVRGATSVVGP